MSKCCLNLPDIYITWCLLEKQVYQVTEETRIKDADGPKLYLLKSAYYH